MSLHSFLREFDITYWCSALRILCMFFSPLTCKSNPVTSVFSPLPLVFNKVCACKKGKNMRSDGFDKTAATLQGLNIAVSCDDTKRYSWFPSHPLIHMVFHLVLHNLAIFLHIHHRKDMPLELQESYIHLAHVPSKLHLRSVPALLMHGIALRHIPDNTYFHFLVLVHLLIPSYFLYHKEQLPVQWFSFLWFLVSFLTLPRLLLLL